MSAIMRLRQARNVEQIAQEIEPLAQSLAALADETCLSMSAQKVENRAQIGALQEERDKIDRTLRDAAQSIQAATTDLRETASMARRAARQIAWQLFLVAILAGAGAGVLSTAYLCWAHPPEFKKDLTLDPKALAEYLKPEIVKALKGR